MTLMSTRVNGKTIDLLRPPWGGAGWYAIIGDSSDWSYRHLEPQPTLAEALLDAVQVCLEER